MTAHKITGGKLIQMATVSKTQICNLKKKLENFYEILAIIYNSIRIILPL